MILKKIYNQFRKPIFRIRGYKLLNWEKTKAFLHQYRTNTYIGNTILLPEVRNAANPQQVAFQEKEARAETMYVWNYKHHHKGHLSKYGNLIIQGNVLCTDGSIQSFFKDIWKPDRRMKKQVPAFVALFSQEQDGILYGGYYDFMFFIVAKLCRMKDSFPEKDFSKLLFSYPIFNTAYEREFLTLLGIKTDNVIDSKEEQLISNQVIIGNGSGWYPHLEDVLSMRNHILKNINFIPDTGKRIYISRSCRRKIINEVELIALLKKFDFTIIEDKPRSIVEQASIYNNADFIIGPHGASFSNVIWCRPDTHLMELFSPNYMPDFFLYLSAIMDMRYSAMFDSTRKSDIDYTSALVEDIYISIPQLENYLKKTLV